MKELYFFGISDDLFVYEQAENGIGAEIDCYDSPAIFKVLDTTGNGLYVTGYYAPQGVNAPVWTVGVAPLDEDVALPEWPLYFRLADNGYSPMLVIEATNDVTVIAAGKSD